MNILSADLALGVSFNWVQYWVLLQWCASVLGVEVGRLVWNFGVLHYYDRHEDKLLDLLGKSINMKEPKITVADADTLTPIFMDGVNYSIEEIEELYTVEQYEHGKFISFEVAE